MSPGDARDGGAKAGLAAENLRLRKALRDMVAMATLPALWIGLDAEGIARTLASALLTTLSLDVVYVRIGEAGATDQMSVLRTATELDAEQTRATTLAIEALLSAGGDPLRLTLPDPVRAGDLRLAITRFGVPDRTGVLVTAARHEDFPSESDRAVLGVGANQTAIVLQRLHAERQSRDARARLQAALTAGAILTWTWEIPNNRLWADEALAHLFGLDASAASGGSLEPYLEAIHPADRELVQASLQRALDSNEDYAADYRVLEPSGAVRWVAARGQLDRDTAAQPLRMSGVLVDITARKQLENELSVRVAELAAMDQRKDEFLATLAHELRNPLAPIRNSLQILKMPRVDAATASRVRDVMERQVNQLVRLVDDLLDVSRVMRGKIELRRQPTELSNVIAYAVETVQPLIEAHGHSLEIDLPHESLLMDVDPVRLSQVIGNLLANAAKYTDNGGSIRVSAQRDDEQVVVRVIDNGIGIPAGMLAHVFELFAQVEQSSSKSHGGLGIGLTLVKNLVEMHRGTVTVRSDGPGGGSEFQVRLPLLRAIPEEAASDIARAPAVARRQRVLVVDDNVDAAESLAVLLRLKGHEVLSVHDGESALSALRKFQPTLVLLDLGMPGMDGHEVASRMRKERALGDCVIAALTGWGQDRDRMRTTASGFDFHLVKPVDPDDLERVLASLGGE